MARLPFRLRRTVVGPMIMAALPMAALAQTLPTAPRVTAGQAQVNSPAANALTVQQTSQRAVIHWQGFGIGAGHQVNFAQPGAGAATLNVVDGAAPSTIAGSLKANGSVYLINRNGIAITPTGQVDVRSGFVASTLGMKDEDFMAGRGAFSGAGSSVVNRGQIFTGPGGYAALLGASVANEGVIRAPLGKVALGSGQAATLDLSGDGFLQVMLPADATTADGQALVTQSGLIEADGGTVMLKAASVRAALRDAVHVPGEIRARSVSGANGAIVLEAGDGRAHVTGRLDASADEGARQGGRIDVAGGDVVLAGATLDASGVDGGGLVRLGGGFQGGKRQAADSADAARFVGRFGTLAPLANAQTTHVDADSSVDVSASGTAGVGGTAILWSDRQTTAAGHIVASGAASGGAVEISSASQVQSIALDRLVLGQRGRLLLDPQNIVIDAGTPTAPAGNVGYGDNTGTETRLRSADLLSLLSAGTDVSLQASQDITWTAGIATVTQPGSGKAGDMALSAGRSITVSGVLTTANGHWTLVANDTAAHGVVDADRGAGLATLDLSDAQFINNNGRLSLTLADGAGNTYRDAGSLRLPRFQGEALTATIAPTATGFGTPRIMLSNVDVSDALTLTGDLQVVSPSTLSGGSFNWSNEATAGIFGEGTVKFVEAGKLVRFGQLSGSDATRLALGSGTVVSHVYGNANPDAAGLGAAQLHVTAGSTGQALDGILSAGSIAVSGPGATASVGSSTSLTLSAGVSPAFEPGLMGGFFIDMRAGSVPLAITPRTVTATVSNGSYVYGSPTAVVSLANLANGDTPTPLATLDGTAGVSMLANAGGYAFSSTHHAGSSTFTLTGLSGAAASNYVLDFSGSASAALTISRKQLSYFAYSGGQTYGTLGAAPSVDFSGLVGSDAVTAVAGFSLAGGTSQAQDARMNAGSYVSRVVGLSGAAAANYEIGSSGNVDGVFTVQPKPLTWSVANAAGTYGTLVSLGAATLDGVLSGDAVTGVIGLSTGLPHSAITRAGSHIESVTGLSGASAANYALAGSGNQPGTLTIAPKTLTYTGADTRSVYGTAVAAPLLDGIVAGDQVNAVAGVTADHVFQLTPMGFVPAGNYRATVASLAGADAGNYVVDHTGSSPDRVTVTPRPLTFQSDTLSRIYGDGTGALPQPVLSGVLPGDSVVAHGGLFGPGGSPDPAFAVPVGTYDIGVRQLLGSGAGNYMVAATGNSVGTLTVTPRTLHWQVFGASTVYGNAPGNATLLSGLVVGDDVVPTVSALDGAGAVIGRPEVGTYLAGVTALAGTAAGNYVLAASDNTTGSLTVTPRPVSYHVAGVGATYGTLATPGAVTLNNVLAGDTVGAALEVRGDAGAVTLAPRTAAGRYLQTVTSLTGNPNYMLAPAGNTDGLLTIARKAVTFDAGGLNTTSTYGSAPALGSAILSGVLPGDQAAAGPTLAAGAMPTGTQAVGSYALTVGSLTGADAGNYEIVSGGSVAGQWQVAPKVLTYTVTPWLDHAATGDTRVYGELNHYPGVAAWQLSGRATLDGVVGSDHVGLAVNAPNLPVSSGSYYQVGTYHWTGGALTGAGASNYVLAASGNRDGLLTITPRPIDVSVYARSAITGQLVLSTEYGTTAPLYPVAGLSGLPNGRGGYEQVGASAAFLTAQGPQQFLDPVAPVGTYALGLIGGLTGADAANYVARLSVLNLQVQPKPVTVQLATATRQYGEGAWGIASVSGLLGTPDVTATYETYSPQTGLITLDGRTPVGRYNINTMGLAGADAGNYVLVTDAGAPHLPANTIATTVTIVPRPLTVAVDRAAMTQTYGGYMPVPSLVGVLRDDDVSVTGQARPYTYAPTDPSLNINLPGTLLDVGQYYYTGILSGSMAHNYVLANYEPTAPAPHYGVITINPRPISVVALPSATTTYGSYAPAQPVFGNLVPGQSVAPIFTATNPASGAATTYTDRSDAGRYTYSVGAITGPGAGNYVLETAQGASNTLQIEPKLLTLTLPTTATGTYGDAAKVATLPGVLFNDDFSLRTVGTAAMPGERLTLAADGTLGYTGRLNVGSYDYGIDTAALVGTKSGNYRVAAPAGGGTVASAQLTVAPRELRYAVDNASGQYGNYKTCNLDRCDPWAPGIDYGLVRFDNLMAGDQVGGTVALLDFKGGAVVPLDSKTPVGPYLQVVTGLTGTSASNYKVADTGSIPGLMSITPAWLSFNTTNGVYIRGVGMIGNPGVATLRGRDGPLIGVDVAAVVTPVFRPTGSVLTMEEVLRARLPDPVDFYVTGLTGAEAGNYRVMPGRFAYGTGSYGQNEVGSLETFADTRLGMGLVDVVPPPTLPQAPTPNSPLSNALGVPGIGGRVDARSQVEVINTGGVDARGADGFVRATAGADGDTNAGITVGDTSIEAGASATGSAGATVSVGDADLSAQASATVDALARFGVTGVRIEAGAEARLDVSLEFGPGQVSYGAHGEATATVKLDRNGVAVTADASAGIYADAGVAGGLGALGNGSIDLSAGTFAFARAENRYGLNDEGELVVASVQHVGVGASVGGQAGISGAAGGVTGGATLYSPGSLGFAAGWTGGYSDGALTIGLDIGGAIGIGGLRLSFNFTINPGEIVGSLANLLLGSSAPVPERLAERADELKNDPVARYAFMTANPLWKESPYANTRGSLDFYNGYTDVLNRLDNIQRDQADVQSTFLRMAATDPQAAADYLRGNAQQQIRTMNGIARDATSNGLQLKVVNGQLNIVNNPLRVIQ